MAEYADYRLNGDDCEQCGMPLSKPGDGYPRYCSERCKRDANAPADTEVVPRA